MKPIIIILFIICILSGHLPAEFSAELDWKKGVEVDVHPIGMWSEHIFKNKDSIAELDWGKGVLWNAPPKDFFSPVPVGKMYFEQGFRDKIFFDRGFPSGASFDANTFFPKAIYSTNNILYKHLIEVDLLLMTNMKSSLTNKIITKKTANKMELIDSKAQNKLSFQLTENLLYIIIIVIAVILGVSILLIYRFKKRLNNSSN